MITNETGEYLTFRLDEEAFALDISQIREVLEFTAITKVPRTPEFMRGVINLYTAQTFDQLRNLTPLTLEAPPATMQLTVPGG